MDVEMKIEQLEKQQAVLNSDLKSLMMDILAKMENMPTKDEVKEDMQVLSAKIDVLAAKVDALTDVVKGHDDDLKYLEVSTTRTANDVAKLKAVR